MSDNIVVETAERIFADLADAQTLNAAKSSDWKKLLWAALEDAGLPLAWVKEDCGGSGASLADGFGVIAAAGRAALPAPLTETMLAGWLLAQSGIPSPAGMMSVAPSHQKDTITLDGNGKLNGRARAVPFARTSQHLAVIASSGQDNSIALVETKACRIHEGHSIGNDDSSTVMFDGVKPLACKPSPAHVTPLSLLMMGVAARSLQMAGALETMLTISVGYANERVAFEKKIGKFQAIQHSLAKLAGETAAAVTASGSAADALANGASDEAIFLEVASAKIRCAEAAEKGAAIAHQVHGAIGFSAEHILHRYTLRALAWRDDFGNESWWAAELGKRVAALGADELWPLVASR